MNKKLQNSALERIGIEAFKDANKKPVYVILDNIRSAQNVGSIFRTMDAFRCEALLLCGITAVPPHREINKTALGATESVEWRYFPDTMEALVHLKAKDIRIYAIEQTQGSVFLDSFDASGGQPVAFIFGNEVDGVSQNIIDACDGSIEIRQYGTKHSLNVAVCAGIVIWEVAGKVKF